MLLRINEEHDHLVEHPVRGSHNNFLSQSVSSECDLINCGISLCYGSRVKRNVLREFNC